MKIHGFWREFCEFFNEKMAEKSQNSVNFSMKTAKIHKGLNFAEKFKLYERNFLIVKNLS